MILRVNGEERRFGDHVRTLQQLLDALDISCRRVAVERNGEIQEREAFGRVLLEEEDRIEIVTFVGGG